MKCPTQYEFRYVKGLVMPPGIALHVGSATHVAVAANLKHKCEHDGQLMPVGAVMELARDNLSERWDIEDVYLQDDEAERGRDTMKGEAIDMAVTLSGLHAEELAPTIQPISAAHIERPFVLEVTELAFDLAGTIDVQEISCIRDTKTAKTTPSQGDVDAETQFTMYAWAASLTGNGLKFPVQVKVDALVKLKTPKAVVIESRREDWQVNALVESIKSYGRLIQAGLFPPSTNGWWCSRKWCGYASRCPYYSGRP